MGIFKKIVKGKHNIKESVLIKENGKYVLKEKEKGVLQTIIISKDIASSREAAARIAKKYGNITTSRETDSSYRFRQTSPENIKKGSYKTFSPEKGVSLVYGQK